MRYFFLRLFLGLDWFGNVVRQGFPVLEIHSRKSQGHRNKVSEKFRNGQGLIMFTSDVSARGMDYPDVSAVLQVGWYQLFDPFPLDSPPVQK